MFVKKHLEACREEVATGQNRDGVVFQLQPFKRVETREGTIPEVKVGVKIKKLSLKITSFPLGDMDM